MTENAYWLILVVLALIVGAVIVYLALTTFKQTLGTVIVDFGVTITTLGQIVFDLVKDIGNLLVLIVNVVGNIATSIFALVQQATATIVNTVVSVGSAVVNLVEVGISAYTDLFFGVINAVVAFFNTSILQLYQILLDFPAQVTSQTCS